MDSLLRLLIKLFISLSGITKGLSKSGIGAYEEWAPGKKLKLLILGYNGARNTGADARVVAAVKQIKELFGPDNINMTVMTLSKKAMEGYFDEDVELVEFSSIYPRDLFRACNCSHAAVICEGSTLKSTFADALSMFYCEGSGIMARQGKPCIAFGSEVGYMNDSLRRFAMETCRSTYFITRTQESQDTLEGLKIKGHKGTDSAWLYDGAAGSERTSQLLQERGWDGEKPLLGVAIINPFIWPVRPSLKKWVRGKQEGRYDKWYFYSDSAQRRKAFDRYVDEIGKAVNSLCAAEDFFPVLLGMEKMDIDACRNLEQRLDMPAAIFPSEEYTADIMAGILLKLSALITSRYHAAVLSMPNGCPIVAVSMDERLDSLMKEIGLEDEYLFHVRDEDLGQKLAGAMLKGLGRKKEIKELLNLKVRGYREEQVKMGEFLKRYITEKLEGTGK